MFRLSPDADERWLVGSSLARWLASTLAHEQLLYGPDGEFLLDAFEEDGEELTPDFAVRQAERALKKDPSVGRCTTTSWGWPTGGWDGTSWPRASFAAAAALDPPNPWPWFDLGRSERELGQMRQAAAAFECAAEAANGGERGRFLVWSGALAVRGRRPGHRRQAAGARPALSHPALGDELTRAAQAPRPEAGRGEPETEDADRAARTRRNWRLWSPRACRPGGSCRCCGRNPWSRGPGAGPAPGAAPSRPAKRQGRRGPAASRGRVPGAPPRRSGARPTEAHVNVAARTTEAHVNVAAHDAGRVAVAGHVNDHARTASTAVNEVVRVDGDGAVAGDGIALGVVSVNVSVRRVDVGLGRSVLRQRDLAERHQLPRRVAAHQHRRHLLRPRRHRHREQRPGGEAAGPAGLGHRHQAAGRPPPSSRNSCSLPSALPPETPSSATAT